MMVTLCTGSVFGSRRATTAWPDSWYAVLRRSSSGITIERRSAPMMILSLARSKSSMSTRRLFPRAANRAASFTMFARSAPEKPGVPRAMMSGLTSGARGTLRMWTLRISSRPRMSGSGTTTCRSKRPGRSSAGSSTSGRVGAGAPIPPIVGPKLARDGAREQRLAGARSAHHQHAARDAAAELLELRRIAQEVDQLGDFLLGLLAARDVGERHGVGRLVEHPRARLAERERAAAAPALHLAHEEDPHADQQQHREPRHEDVHEERGLLFGFGLDLDAVLEQVGNQPDVARRVAGDALAFGGLRLELPPLDRHLRDAPGLHLFQELRIFHRRLRRLAGIELIEHGHQHQPDDEPDDQVLKHVVQVLAPYTALRQKASYNGSKPRATT